jgi:hypothetical protein
MGAVLSNAKYRRTPPPARKERPEPGRLPRGRQLVYVIGGLVVLAAATLGIVLLSDDDDPTTAPTSATSTTRALGGDAPDDVVARQVLPATLGQGWTDVSRETTPVPPEIDEDDPCSTAGQPIQSGLLIRAAMDHLGTGAVVEKAALVGGVVQEGTPVPSLEDPAVIDCLHQGLQPQVAEGTELRRVDQGTPAAPAGAELSGIRFEAVDENGEVGGRFDLLLLQRDRAVSFVLLAVLFPEEATPLEEVVAALDGALEPAAARLN